MARVLLSLPVGKGLRVFGLEAEADLPREVGLVSFLGKRAPDLPVRDGKPGLVNLEKGMFGCGDWLLRSA